MKCEELERRIKILEDTVDILKQRVTRLDHDTNDYTLGLVIKINETVDKIVAIRTVRTHLRLGLRESKEIVDRAPTTIKGLDSKTAKALMNDLNTIGVSAYLCDYNCSKCYYRFQCWSNR